MRGRCWVSERILDHVARAADELVRLDLVRVRLRLRLRVRVRLTLTLTLTRASRPR